MQHNYSFLLCFLLLIFFFLGLFLAAPAPYGSSQARDWIQSLSATYTTAIAMLDP